MNEDMRCYLEIGLELADKPATLPKDNRPWCEAHPHGVAVYFMVLARRLLDARPS